MELLLSPHADDETLFAAYVQLRARPLVLVCFNGRRARHLAGSAAREQESAAATEILGCKAEFLRAVCDPADWAAVEQGLAGYEPDRVWAPLPEPDGHSGHNGLARLAARLWPGRVSYYATYTLGGGKSRTGRPVEGSEAEQTLKRQALVCYRTQIDYPPTAAHFAEDLTEYVTDEIKLNLGCGDRRLPGFVNLDERFGWRFQDGLGAYGDGTVDAVTLSHTLMYVPLTDWPAVYRELARVLRPGGIIRITEDDMEHPRSRSYQGARPGHRRTTGCTLTGPDLVQVHLEQAGLVPHRLGADETLWHDKTLLQQNYGDPPDVFFMEARKPNP